MKRCALTTSGKRGKQMNSIKETRLLQQGFVPNAFYEKLGALRATNPPAFDSLSPSSKMALFAYETAKREHARLEAIRDAPEAA